MRKCAYTLFPTLLLTLLAPPATALDETPIIVDSALETRFEELIAEFETLAGAPGGSEPAHISCQVGKLRRMVRELQQDLAACAARAATGEPVRRAGVQVQPSGPVAASREPPGEADLDRMQRAIESTHLPGPPPAGMKEPVRPTGEYQTAEQALNEAMDILERIQSDLDGGMAKHTDMPARFGHTRAAVEHARDLAVCPPVDP